MSTAYQRAPDELVANTMTTSLLTCAPTTTLIEAAHIMAERRVGAILVTEGDRLMGILTERDVLRTVGTGSIDGTVVRSDDARPDHRRAATPATARPRR